MSSPADLGWGDPRALTSADMTGAQLWPGHVVQVRNDDVAVVMTALVRRLRAAGWNGPDPLLDEWGYNRRLKRWAEDKYRAQGLTEAQWLQTAPLSEWSDHAWGTAVDLDTAANPMLATRPANPQAHTTMPMAACPGIAASLGLEWGGTWDAPWDPQHWQVAVTPQRLAAIAAPVRRSMEVLDYSSGYPAPGAIKAAGYAGVVRYVGTPGRGKNLTRAEAQAMRAAGIPIALVYEASAGWMFGGKAAGVAAAKAVLADPALVSSDTYVAPQIRCVYFADDEDTVTSAQFAAVAVCLDGAASVLGRARTGVYGEADVIDAALPGHAAWGWQTRAWSGGRVSGKAALLQQTGYVYPGGVECDRNTILQDDWGQTPYQGDDMPLTADDIDAVKTAIHADMVTLLGLPGGLVNDMRQLLIRQAGVILTGRGNAAFTDAIIGGLGPSAVVPQSTAMAGQLAALAAQVSAVTSALAQLATNMGGSVDYIQVQQAAEAGAEAALAHLRITTDEPAPPPTGA
jgi:hypothetical protein